MTDSGGTPDMMAMAIVKWRALSLKRLVHLDELKRTGRWRRHFATEESFDKAIREANTDAERWKLLTDQNNEPVGEAAA